MRLGIVVGALVIGLAACALALVPLALGKRNRAHQVPVHPTPKGYLGTNDAVSIPK
jgi:hypothetical protein